MKKILMVVVIAALVLVGCKCKASVTKEAPKTELKHTCKETKKVVEVLSYKVRYLRDGLTPEEIFKETVQNYEQYELIAYTVNLKKSTVEYVYYIFHFVHKK